MPVTLDNYKQFAFMWKQVSLTYRLAPSCVEHIFMPAYEATLRGYDPSRGSFFFYAKCIIRGYLSAYVERSMAQLEARERMLPDAAGTPDCFTDLERRDLVDKLLQHVKLTSKQQELLYHVIYEGASLQAFADLGHSPNRRAAFEVKRGLINKLRKAYQTLNGETHDATHGRDLTAAGAESA